MRRDSLKRIWHNGRGYFAALVVLFGSTSIAAGQVSPADSEINDAIEDELRYDPAVENLHMNVSTIKGIVTLQGTTDNLLAKERAERIAETVKGVRSVVNLLEVHPPVLHSDDAIRRDVEEALLMNPATDSYEITVAVKEGTVTLSGTVESWAERRLSEKVAKGVRGVTALRNGIEVEGDVVRYDPEIQAEIEEALRWDVLVDHGLIDVEVEDGQVTLRGVVGSAAEKREARFDAWVAGVKSVDDSALTVSRWARDEDLRQGKYTFVSDTEIERALELALLHDPRVLGSNITVTSQGGVVTLSGVVENLKAWRSADEVARSTVGVSSVENHLKVQPENPPTDAEIADMVDKALERSPYVDADGILVTVIDGITTLSGSVGSGFERAEADDIASTAVGVVRVKNLLEVGEESRPLLFDPFVSRFDPRGLVWYRYEPFTTDASDQSIKESIEHEFFWSPFVDGTDITVTVDNGVATLTGTVSSFVERQDATKNAYEGGAVLVENELLVIRSN